MAPIPRLQPHQGPAVLSYGFRPFFLLAALYAGFGILIWIPLFHGHVRLPSAFAPLDWHVHEMLYGFVTAVITGFLLTAVPNWTGRLPLQGTPLLVLVLAWTAGRLAVAVSASIGWRIAALIDTGFLVLLTAAIAREILAGRNWRNLKVLGAVVLLTAANAIFHVEAQGGGADYGKRLGIATVIGLIVLIGGRIVPSFTRNWLVRENPGRLPAPFGRFDAAAIGATGAALALWVLRPEGAFTALALVAAGLLQAARLGRWAGDRTLRDPLVLILHLAYAFVPLGFLLLGGSALAPDRIPDSAGLHAWTAGAIGAMTLAVMTRATLGHTGRALVAGRATQALYAAVVAGALARIAAAFAPGAGQILLSAAALAWSGAFLGFAALYGPMLLGPRAGARRRERPAAEEAAPEPHAS